MKSHSYLFKTREALEICVRPLLIVLIVAVTLHIGNRLNLLPPPRQTLDIDRTIMLHQLDAARSSQDASLVFIGDSSCLMGVDTLAVTDKLGMPAINLGTLSFLDLANYSSLLQEYFKHNSNKVRAVVVLCHPESLRRHGPKPYYAQFFDHALAGEAFIEVNQPYEYVLRLLGLDLFRDRVESRLLPSPLAREFGQHYGFSTDLYRFMSAHRGSASEPGAKLYSGDARYYLAAHQEEVSQMLHDTLPPQVKLIVGITPSPQSFLAKAYPLPLSEILRKWSVWLQADAVLTNLPVSYPDHFCASVTHLTPEGRAIYTEALVEQLRGILPSLPAQPGPM